MVKKTRHGNLGRGIVLCFAPMVLLCASWALAQEAQDPEPEPETLAPGLHIRAEETAQGSQIANAARMGGSVVIGGEEMEAQSQVAPTTTYVVKAGDTLWDICSSYFGDPYVWPKIWSYNSKITNPHWIFPGDAIWLEPREKTTYDSAAPPKLQPQPVIARARPAGNVLRNRGFVDKESLKRSGVLVGAFKEVMLFGQYDEVYVEFGEGGGVKPGDKVAAFAVLDPVNSVDDPGTEIGKLVEIFGFARVVTYDSQKRIARVSIDEAMKPMERGTLIGPVHRRFDVLTAVTADRDLEGHVISFLDPVILSAQQQVVFIDRGREQGVKDGNRLLAVKKRDNWREINKQKDDNPNYPWEVIAELQVVEARPHTSTCLVTSAAREIEVGQVVRMRKGY